MSREEDLKEFERVKPFLQQKETTSDVYMPPTGEPIDKSGLYVPDDPTAELDRLINTERRFIFPIAWCIARVFPADPLTDDMYRAKPEYMQREVLAIVVSRTGVRQVQSGVIAWPAVRVIVKQYDIVRVHVIRDFGQDTCDVDEIELWTNQKMDYVHVRDPNGRPIGPETLTTILSRYAKVEGILPSSMLR